MPLGVPWAYGRLLSRHVSSRSEDGSDGEVEEKDCEKDGEDSGSGGSEDSRRLLTRRRRLVLIPEHHSLLVLPKRRDLLDLPIRCRLLVLPIRCRLLVLPKCRRFLFVLSNWHSFLLDLPNHRRFLLVLSNRRSFLLPNRRRRLLVLSNRRSFVLPNRCRILVLPNRCGFLVLAKRRGGFILPTRSRFLGLLPNRGGSVLPNCRRFFILPDCHRFFVLPDRRRFFILPDRCGFVLSKRRRLFDLTKGHRFIVEKHWERLDDRVPPPGGWTIPVDFEAAILWPSNTVLIALGTKYLPRPHPPNHAHVYVCEDGLWGEHEYTLVPQPFDHVAPHLACLPVASSASARNHVLFCRVDDQDMAHSKEPGKMHLFVLTRECREELEKVVKKAQESLSTVQQFLARIFGKNIDWETKPEKQALRAELFKWFRMLHL
ncbi:hypothetical protein K488DRAFT_75261, partial [Vararia minispora EC-137]